MTKPLEPISEARKEPFAGVARLDTVRKRGLFFLSMTSEFYGTGVLVDRRFVITAAHNLHQNLFSKLQSINISFGYNSGESMWVAPRIYGLRSVRIAKGYGFGRLERDFSVIDLGEKAPAVHSVFRLPKQDELKELVARRSELHLAGYPGNEGHDGQVLKGASTFDYHADELFITYDIDTATGNSGGPIWFESKGEYVLAGIHISEGSGPRGKEGKAIVLSDGVLSEIKNWIKQE